jgi:hypothetical protein
MMPEVSRENTVPNTMKESLSLDATTSTNREGVHLSMVE